MALPNYQQLMGPLLQELADGGDHSVADLRDQIALRLHLDVKDRELLLPSGKQPMFDNRLGWTKTYLERAGLLRTIRRGVYQITERGTAALASRVQIDRAYLERFIEFQEFIKRPQQIGDAPDLESTKDGEKETLTPQEVLDSAYQEVRQSVEADLLAAVLAGSFTFFERLVVQLLVKMGYGGSIKDAGRAIGKAGDDGLDGIIKEDHLGLDAIYVQAKKWKPEHKVGRPDVQAFAGSLEGVRGKKGVFLTTSTFSEEAREYVSRIEKKVVLIDGHQLAGLMLDFDVGVTNVSSYDVKKVDGDFFAED